MSHTVTSADLIRLKWAHASTAQSFSFSCSGPETLPVAVLLASWERWKVKQWGELAGVALSPIPSDSSNLHDHLGMKGLPGEARVQCGFGVPVYTLQSDEAQEVDSLQGKSHIYGFTKEKVWKMFNPKKPSKFLKDRAEDNSDVFVL